MPHLRSLNALRTRLGAELAPEQVFRSQEWGNPRAMTQVLRELRRDLGASAAAPGPDVLLTSLKRFASTQDVENFTELKHVCYGVSVPLSPHQGRIIDQAPLFDRLLQLVAEREGQPKQFRRCYQGLLNGYFGFDRRTRAPGDSTDNWAKLKTFLGTQLQPVLDSASSRGIVPDWLPLLDAHRNLLTDDPCRRYAEAIAAGGTDELRRICTGLGIASNSWVWDEAILAYVHAVCERKDESFRSGLSGILDLINGRTELALPENVARRSTAITVARYAQMHDRPEHAELRDNSLQWIGNPRLHRTAWDAVVQFEPAREMVEGWLKRRLIRDFFELLAEDGSADLRRLNYWLKWEPQISSDMWFVLGGDARRNRSEAFLKLRKRMVGYERILAGNNDENNAFVMRIGPLLIIEFGKVGNACYVFAASDFKTNLEANSFTIHELKQKLFAKKLSHAHQWEARFDAEIEKMLRSVPSGKGILQPAEPHALRARHQVVPPMHRAALPDALDQGSARVAGSTTSKEPQTGFTQANFDLIKTFCVQRGIEWEDNRPKQGALWILLKDRDQSVAFSALLERYGFKFSAGRGFWLK